MSYSFFHREQAFRNLNYNTCYHFEIFLISPFAHKNYFNVVDVAIAVVMPLSEGHQAKTESTFMK